MSAPSNGNETQAAAANAPSSPSTSSIHKSDIEKHSLESIDQAEVDKAVKKMDLVIMPIMTMFYLLSFLVSLLPTLVFYMDAELLPGSYEHWYVPPTLKTLFNNMLTIL